MTRNVTAERAFADYLAMEPRSLAKLFQNYSKTMPNGPPLATIKYWSKKHEWRQKIAEHEAQVEDELRGKAAKAQANERWNAAKACRDAAEVAIKRGVEMLPGVQGKNGTDVKAIFDTAINLISKADVLEGGVSDRIEEIVEPEYRGLGKFRRMAEANKAKASKETAKDRGTAQDGDDDQ